MGHLQLSDHIVQNRQAGEQMMHWDMLNEENLIPLFNMPQCVMFSPVWQFFTM